MAGPGVSSRPARVRARISRAKCLREALQGGLLGVDVGVDRRRLPRKGKADVGQPRILRLRRKRRRGGRRGEGPSNDLARCDSRTGPRKGAHPRRGDRRPRLRRLPVPRGKPGKERRLLRGKHHWRRALRRRLRRRRAGRSSRSSRWLPLGRRRRRWRWSDARQGGDGWGAGLARLLCPCPPGRPAGRLRPASPSPARRATPACSRPRRP